MLYSYLGRPESGFDLCLLPTEAVQRKSSTDVLYGDCDYVQRHVEKKAIVWIWVQALSYAMNALQFHSRKMWLTAQVQKRIDH